MEFPAWFIHLITFIAGSLHDKAAGTTQLRSCLTSAVNGDTSRTSFAGDFLYDLLNVKRYNLYFDIIPAAIAYPVTAEEVSKAVQCAVAAGLGVQARSGGHSYGDYCIGGVSGSVILDLKHMNQVTYDTSSQLATLGPGCNLDDISQGLVSHGRTTPHGTSPQVGVGGHFTIGGLGPLSRQYGPATDQIVSAEVVLANGSIVTTSETQGPDLFFAIRGAAASFGVVTSFTVRTYQVPSEAVQFTYNLTFGDETARSNAFRAFQRLATQPDLSRNLSLECVVFNSWVLVTGIFFGSQPEFDALNIASQLPGGGGLSIDIINSAVGVVGEGLLNTAQRLGGGVPTHFYSKSLAFNGTTLVPDEAVADLFETLDTASSNGSTAGLVWFLLFDGQGGATNDVPANGTAYPFRDTLFFLQSYVIDLLGTEQSKARAFLDGIDTLLRTSVPGLTGAYPGYVDPFLSNGQQEYWRGNLPRLQRIKALLDPGNVFRNPQSVQAEPS